MNLQIVIAAWTAPMENWKSHEHVCIWYPGTLLWWKKSLSFFLRQELLCYCFLCDFILSYWNSLQLCMDETCKINWLGFCGINSAYLAIYISSALDAYKLCSGYMYTRSFWFASAVCRHWCSQQHGPGERQPWAMCGDTRVSAARVQQIGSRWEGEEIAHSSPTPRVPKHHLIGFFSQFSPVGGLISCNI
jgi:hypothetical protein